MGNILVRNASFEEMPLIIQMAEREGWNPGNSDHDFFFRADPSGFIVMVHDNEMLGCISSIEYSKEFGFIGFHIIAEQLRGQGLGRKLLNVAVERLGERNIGLNSLPGLKEFYEKSGFKFDHKIITFKGVCDGKLDKPSTIGSPFLQPFELLHEFDTNHFFCDRKDFIMSWLNQPQSLLLGKVEENKYLGYGLIRPATNGYKIAPLFADDPVTAKEILKALTGHFPEGTNYYIDIPEPNSSALEIAEELRLTKEREYLRMYTKSSSNNSLDNIYGYSSFELG